MEKLFVSFQIYKMFLKKKISQNRFFQPQKKTDYCEIMKNIAISVNVFFAFTYMFEKRYYFQQCFDVFNNAAIPSKHYLLFLGLEGTGTTIFRQKSSFVM